MKTIVTPTKIFPDYYVDPISCEECPETSDTTPEIVSSFSKELSALPAVETLTSKSPTKEIIVGDFLSEVVKQVTKWLLEFISKTVKTKIQRLRRRKRRGRNYKTK